VTGPFALAFVLATGAAFAQSSPPNEAEIEAKAAIKRGLASFARRDAEAALAEYKKAQKLVPDANLPHRYAAEALVELERYEEAIQEYETYLRIKPDVSDAAEVRQRMERARARIDGTIELGSSPQGASVFVDGSSTKAGVTPLSGLKLKRGQHAIVLRLPGRKDVALSPVVRGGEALSLMANFADPPAPSAATHDPPRPHESSKTSTTLGWITLGVGGAVLATTLAVDLFVLSSAFDTFEEKRRVDDPAAGDALSDVRHLQIGTVVGYAAGAALAATGAVVLLWPKQKNADVKAGIGPGGAVLTARF
jgi:tetratricopeptide (TPR) repeat protein